MADTTKTTPTANDLIIYMDEDGKPWAAFVWGEADPDAVAALITEKVVEDETGFSYEYLMESCTWPPRVETYWVCLSDDGEEMVRICQETDEGATRITGHRFYPQD